MISRELLEILACPRCKGPVELSADNDGLLCRTCRLIYEIRNGIPVMVTAWNFPLSSINLWSCRKTSC